MKKQNNNTLNFIDLFAGIGGFRIALERTGAKCVFSSEIDKWACETYERNFGQYPSGDISKIKESEIPSHDILCAGFPCQAFSIGGYRKGFDDTRGTLFFEVARILKNKRPSAFILENVKLAYGIRTMPNSIITKTFNQKNIIIGGYPARFITHEKKK